MIKTVMMECKIYYIYMLIQNKTNSLQSTIYTKNVSEM